MTLLCAPLYPLLSNASGHPNLKAVLYPATRMLKSHHQIQSDNPLRQLLVTS